MESRKYTIASAVVVIAFISIIVIILVTGNKNNNIGLSNELYNSVQQTLNKDKVTIENLAEVKELYIVGTNNFKGLDKLTNLECLSIVFSNEESNEECLDIIKELDGIKELALYSEEMDLTEIFESNSCDTIENLTLSSNNLTTVKGISKYTNLKTLSLIHCANLSDIEEIAELKNLESLTVNGNLSDISMLKQCSKLKDLGISSTSNDKMSLAGLDKLTNVKDLFIAGKNIADIEILSNMQQLEILTIVNTSVSNIPTLSNLKTLYIQQCDNIKNINNIKEFKNLEDLSIIMCTSITKDILNDLKEMKHLKNCEIRDCLNINEKVTLSDL